MATDSAGNVFVVGIFNYELHFGATKLTASFTPVGFIAKMDAQGNWLWAKSLDSSIATEIYNVSVDAAGNAYIAGAFRGNLTLGSTTLVNGGSYPNILAAKIDGQGNWKWAVTSESNTTQTARVEHILPLSSGEVYVSGLFYGNLKIKNQTLTRYGSSDIFVAKLDTQQKWAWGVSMGGGSLERALGLYQLSDGTFRVLAKTTGDVSFGPLFYKASTSTTNSLAAAHLDASGNWLNYKVIGAGASGSDFEAYVDSLNRNYFMGYFSSNMVMGPASFSSAGLSDIFISKGYP